MSEPMRMCAGCRIRASKHDLIRVVRTPDGEVFADAREKAPGRGAYICRDQDCFRKIRKSRALERMLGVAVPEETYEAIASMLDGENG